MKISIRVGPVKYRTGIEGLSRIYSNTSRSTSLLMATWTVAEWRQPDLWSTAIVSGKQILLGPGVDADRMPESQLKCWSGGWCVQRCESIDWPYLVDRLYTASNQSEFLSSSVPSSILACLKMLTLRTPVFQWAFIIILIATELNHRLTPTPISGRRLRATIIDAWW